MAEHRIKGGRALADGDPERMAEAAGRGECPGTPGAWVVWSQRRPTIADEGPVTVAFKVLRSQHDALDREAAGRNETRSQFMRDALDRALAAGQC